MSGWTTYTRFQRIEEMAQGLGFRLGRPRMSAWSDSGTHDTVSILPGTDAMPIYAREAELFTGSFHEVEVWLAGWIRAQEYDRMIRMSDPDKRKKYEAQEVERQRRQAERQAIREEKKVMWKVLKEK